MLKLTRDPKTSSPRVTFVIPAESSTGAVSVVGDFNNWTPGKHVLRKRNNGTLSVAVPVQAGSTLRFRYLGEDGHWFDEPEADFIDQQGSVLEVRAS